MKLTILTPCHDGMYHTNYNDLLLGAATLGFNVFSFNLFKSEYESDIHRHRSKMVSQWLYDKRFVRDAGILWIDADIGGPEGVVQRIASLPDDMHILSGSYFKKNGSNQIVARGITEERHPIDPNIVKAELVPTGFCRVSRKCLQAVYDSKKVEGCRDWWRLVYQGGLKKSSLGLGYESEDYAFCLDAAELGFTSWLDRSIRLTHRGHKLY